MKTKGFMEGSTEILCITYMNVFHASKSKKKRGTGGGKQKYEALNRDRYGALTVIKFARNVLRSGSKHVFQRGPAGYSFMRTVQLGCCSDARVITQT